MPVTPSQNRLHSLQALRFYAAAIVVIFHAEENAKWLARTYAGSYTPMGLTGDFGVYIFFIISGFIMGHVTQGRYGRPGETGRFLIARLSRIIPIYWILTLCMVLLTAVLHAKGAGKSLPDLSVATLIKSLLFIPYIGKEQDHWPILGQGWSLNHEMLFYVIVAIALWLRESMGKAFIIGSLVTLTLLGALAPLPEFLALWAKPVNLLFLLGLGLAFARPTLPFSPHLTHTLMVGLLVASGVLSWLALFPLWAKVGTAFLLVYLCVATRNDAEPRSFDKLTERLGDASYSMYLVHTFLIYFTSAVWAKLFGSAYLLGFVCVILLESIVVSWAVNRWIEIPLNARCRLALERLTSRKRDRIAVAALSSATRHH